ncbi:hypothetical protein ABPG77_009418 [Micractinium sp. CCAP 211/92]
MSAVLPRSKSGSKQPKLSKSSQESSCKKSKRQMMGGSMQHSLSGKSSQELAATGSHPWAGVADALLRPLPPDWQHNIQQAFSQLGDAIGNLFGGAAKQGQRFRRGF